MLSMHQHHQLLIKRKASELSGGLACEDQATPGSQYSLCAAKRTKSSTEKEPAAARNGTHVLTLRASRYHGHLAVKVEELHETDRQVTVWEGTKY
jgi:hypothetical protein